MGTLGRDILQEYIKITLPDESLCHNLEEVGVAVG